MDGVHVEDCIPGRNMAASEARASSSTPATPRLAVRKGRNPKKAKSVLIIWETRIYSLLAPFTLKTHRKPEHPRRGCPSDTPILQMGRHGGEGGIPTSPLQSKDRGPQGDPPRSRRCPAHAGS